MQLGWMAARLARKAGHTRVMDIVADIAGAVAAGFFVTVAPLSVPRKIIYANFGAILGAVVSSMVRHVRGNWERGSALQEIFYTEPPRSHDMTRFGASHAPDPLSPKRFI
jgi:uncharacterized membrane protein YeaQ/YmgE (transglycosylase-associated protein family)